ncbi:MAG TPA: DUF6379 domain-containing protein [Cellulomonas sp.]
MDAQRRPTGTGPVPGTPAVPGTGPVVGPGRSLFDGEQIGADETVSHQYAIPLRLPGYRSLPLSCIDSLTVTIDGDRVTADRTSLDLNAHRYPTTLLCSFPDVWWFALDPAAVLVALDEPLDPGPHTVTGELVTRDPHRPDEALPYTYSATSVLRVGGDAPDP